MKKILVVFASLVAMAVPAFAQATADPAILAAKEETEVIYDLGRFFGYLLSMQEEEPDLALISAQRSLVLEIMEEIESMERIEADWAEEVLDELELDILNPAQLMAIDQIALRRQADGSGTASGTSGSGAGAGRSGSTEEGSGPLNAYINGGAFNPIIDQGKSIGQGFFELLETLR